MRRELLIASIGALVLSNGYPPHLAPPVSAQHAQFRGAVDVVTLNVSVVDASHRRVSDLSQEDFLILEDGRPQVTTLFQKTAAPTAVALLLDTSGSMDRTLAMAQDAAVGFARGLPAGDVVSIIDFNSRVRIRQTFTGDAAALEEAVRTTRVGGSTALYNALYIALKELNRLQGSDPPSERRRRAVVVLSDGDDTSSLVTFEEVLDLATRSDTAVYAIGLLGERPRGRRRSRSHDAKFLLRQLAETTGGRAFFPDAPDAFNSIYQEIRTELSNQYSLAYESDNPKRDGQYRRIAVRVKRSGVVARTRAGYFAPRR